MSKEAVAAAIVKRVKDGDVLGLGSGSTAELAVIKLAERIAKEKIKVSGIPTSHQIAILADAAGIEVLTPLSAKKISWAFDGADEVDPQFNLIKGRGGAMLLEKIIARRAGDNFVVIVDEAKLVPKLGAKFPIPVEIIPEALPYVQSQLKELGATEVNLRIASDKYGPTISEHNNFIVDAKFKNVDTALDAKIKQITGVVEHGLFVNFTKELLVAKGSSVFSQKFVAGKLVESPA